jgi:hypothetical protein
MLAHAIIGAGGSVVVPQNSPLIECASFTGALFESAPAPSLPYGGIFLQAGLHLMETAGGHLVESLTGLGATGVEMLLVFTADAAAQGHPFVPTLQVSDLVNLSGVDLLLEPAESGVNAIALAGLIVRVLSGTHQPLAQAVGNVDFQVTRGWMGVST